MSSLFNKKGKIFFSKKMPKDIKVFHRVSDPMKNVSLGFLKSLRKCGILPESLNMKLETDHVKKKILLNSRINIKEVETVLSASELEEAREYLPLITGNRIGNMDYHISKIITNIEEGRDIWIDIDLFNTLPFDTEELEGVEIILEDNFNPNSLVNVSNFTLAKGIKLFSLLNNKQMDKVQSAILWQIEDNLMNNIGLNLKDFEQVFNIVRILKYKEVRELKSINLYDKLIELLIINHKQQKKIK